MKKKKKKKEFLVKLFPKKFHWTLRTMWGYFKEDMRSTANTIGAVKYELSARTKRLEKVLNEMMPPLDYKIYRITDNFMSVLSIFALIAGIYGLIQGEKLLSPIMLFSMITLLGVPIVWSKMFSKKINKCVDDYKKKHEWDDDDDDEGDI